MQDNEPPPEITNRLAIIRKQRGLSASVLAGLVGVSRQAIYAIEAGSYVPNTTVGLRLAQTLSVSMEELFSLAEESAAAWYLPSSDVNKGVRKQARITGKQLLLAGCDPAMSIVARHLKSAGVELTLLHQNSSQSLSLLKSGYAQIAGSHFPENAEVINRLFRSQSTALFSFAVCQEGLVVQNGNPKHIQGVQDLARKDVTFINRETGSGSRALLDSHLKRLRLNVKAVSGYLRTAPGHLAAAAEVKSGNVDCCLATEAAARFFGLTFIPLESVRYDLAVRKQQLTEPAFQILFDAINQLAFRRKLQSIAGYDTSVTGTRIQ